MANTVVGVKGFVRVDFEGRFWSRVDRSPGYGPHGTCWRWTGGTDGRYGQIWRDGKRVRAHRASWEMALGTPFPPEKDACHHCDTPLCVNPAHVFPGTPSENAIDAVRKGRVVTPAMRDGWVPWNAGLPSCKRGHAFTPENTIRKGVRRSCRTCQRQHQARYDAKRRGRDGSTPAG